MRNLGAALGFLTACTVALGLGNGLTRCDAAPPATSEPVKATAIKLPDGTVVFWTKNPEEANPAVEGLLLSPQDYKNLVEQAEQARKAKPQTPSSVAIRVKVEARGDRLVAALALTYSFRTTQPRTLLVLGCQRGVLVGAKTGQGRLPILNPPGDEGLTLFVEAAGDQTVTLDVEVPVAARGTKNEIGFDLGLPRAAITTVQLDAAPAPGIKSVTLGTRVPDPLAVLPLKPGEAKRSAHAVDPLLTKPVPLGATDVLELTWEPLSPMKPTAALPTADGDVVVHVDETQVETVARLRLRGPLKEWPLQLPLGADVVVERAGAAGAEPAPQPEPMPPTVVRPGDPNKPVWVVRTPGEAPNAEWLVTATVRVQRPKPSDPKFRGPYGIGPFLLLAPSKQTGRINIFAGPTVRLSFKALAEFRRQDLPAPVPEDHVALFTFAGPPTAAPNARANPGLEFDARVAPTAIRARAAHVLKLTPGGWRLESTVRVVPPPRGELEQIVVELPAEWPALEATPEELVESLHIVKDGAPRLFAVRFHTPQKLPFTLKLISTRALPPKPAAAEERESRLVLSLPRFPQADEREASLTATVPEGFEVRGNISLWEAGQPSATTDPLIAAVGAPNRPAVAVSVTGTFERAVARVELIWQPHRPALVCENRVDVSLQPRQLLVQQVLKFKPSPDDRRPVRLRGPEGLLGLQSIPALDPVGPGLWEFRSNAEPGKEFALTVAFALRLANPSADPTVDLLWPESATRTETVLRVWGGATGRRVDRYEGGWRELPAEAVPSRDTLPLLTLAASVPAVPLKLDLSSLGDSGLPTVWIERAYLRATVGESATVIHEKLLLKRWLGTSLEVELPRIDTLELSVDGKPVEALPAPVGADGRDSWVLTVPLPETKGNKMVVVEWRYRMDSPRTPYRERLCVPPPIRGAFYRTPLRWLLATDPGLLAFVPAGSWEPEFRWVWRGFGFSPTGGESPQELEKWFSEGTEADANEPSPWAAAGGDAVAGRQSVPDAVPVLLVPRLGWLAGWSGAFYLVGFAASYLKRVRLAFALAVAGSGLAIASAICPLGLAQVLAAMQPGAAALATTLAGLTAWRFRQARRLQRLPGFSRDRTGVPPGTASPETGNRSSRGLAVPVSGNSPGSSGPLLAEGG